MCQICDKLTSTLSQYITERESDFGKFTSSPTSVSPLFIRMIEDVKGVEDAATKLFPEKRKRGQTSVRPNQGGMNSSNEKEKNQFDGMFDKLFGEKVVYFAKCERAYASILVLVHKLTLKVIINIIIY